MPINPSKPIPKSPQQSIWAPDFISSGVEVHPATLAMDYNESIPPDFNELSKEEQERIMLRYRFLGIKLRPDIKDKTVPIVRKTMDIP